MIINVDETLTGGTILVIIGLIYKASIAHFQIRNVMQEQKKIGVLKEEQTKIIEALERTYATREYVYQTFITRQEHRISLQYLEEKSDAELRHLTEKIDHIIKLMEGSNTGTSR